MLKRNWVYKRQPFWGAIIHCLAFPEISVHVHIHLVLYLLLTTGQAIGYQDKTQIALGNQPKTALFGTYNTRISLIEKYYRSYLTYSVMITNMHIIKC